MKKCCLYLFLLLPAFTFSQEYKLFNASSKMLFADSDADEALNTYSLSIESGKEIGTDSIYNNFFGLNSDWFESDTCVFWGSTECNKQNIPVWTGPRIKFDNIETWRFFNLNNDSLTFLFNIEIDGPLQFYRDSIQQFNMMYVSDDTMTVLGYVDTVRSFVISHTDLEGNTIDSPLNGHQILISKTIGLARFFVVDSFPEVLKPLYLIGSEVPAGGIYQLTNEMVYDYQVGDEIQYLESSWYQPPAPPWYYYTRYRKWIFLERNETPDSLNYLIRQELFYEDSIGIGIDTIAKRYLRSKVIAKIPFEKFDGSTKQFNLLDYCDQNRWTYTVQTTEGAVFCEPDTCWGHGDTFGPPEEWFTFYVESLGLHTYNYSMDFEHGFNIQKKLVYFKKNGEECGGQVYVGVDKVNKHEVQIELIPNPASNEVQISSPIPMQRIVIKDLSGIGRVEWSLFSKEATIDVSQLGNGLYIVRVLLENEKVITKKLLVLK